MVDHVKEVEELFKLPQCLCKMCGRCCRIATFKGGLTYEQLVALSKKKPVDAVDAVQVDGANNFLAIFKPYESIEKAREVVPDFVDRILAHYGRKDGITFYTCRYLSPKNFCMIHEDRPHLCRMYPIPHEKTLFNVGCGFEEKSKENWEKIKIIVKQLDETSEALGEAVNEQNLNKNQE